MVDISTSSEDDVQFTIQVCVEDEFHLGYGTQLKLQFLDYNMLHVTFRLNDERRLWLTPSENRFYKFEFPPGVSQVAVRSGSPDDFICLTISVQSAQVISLLTLC